MMSPAMPAAGMQWLIIDFTDPTGRLAEADLRPNTLRRAVISVLSPSGMPVPWASMSPTEVGSMPVCA